MTAESQGTCEVSQGMSHFVLTVEFSLHETPTERRYQGIAQISHHTSLYPTDSSTPPMICNAALKLKVYKHSCCPRCLGEAIHVQKPSLKVPEFIRRAAC